MAPEVPAPRPTDDRTRMRRPPPVRRRRDGTDCVHAAEHVRLAESAVSADLEGLWILLVAGAEDTRVRLRVALSLFGADVVSASTAWEASRLVRAGAFDVVIVDIDTPDPDGPLLREAARDLPILALSSTGHSARSLAAGGVAVVLTKPIYPEPVVRAVCSLGWRRTVPRKIVAVDGVGTDG